MVRHGCFKFNICFIELLKFNCLIIVSTNYKNQIDLLHQELNLYNTDLLHQELNLSVYKYSKYYAEQIYLYYAEQIYLYKKDKYELYNAKMCFGYVVIIGSEIKKNTTTTNDPSVATETGNAESNTLNPMCILSSNGAASNSRIDTSHSIGPGQIGDIVFIIIFICCSLWNYFLMTMNLFCCVVDCIGLSSLGAVVTGPEDQCLQLIIYLFLNVVIGIMNLFC